MFFSIDQFIADGRWVDYALKGFGMIFALIYLLFSIVILKQTQTMNKTLQTNWGKFISLVSTAQIFFSLFLFIYSIFFI